MCPAQTHYGQNIYKCWLNPEQYKGISIDFILPFDDDPNWKPGHGRPDSSINNLDRVDTLIKT